MKLCQGCASIPVDDELGRTRNTLCRTGSSADQSQTKPGSEDLTRERTKSGGQGSRILQTSSTKDGGTIVVASRD